MRIKSKITIGSEETYETDIKIEGISVISGENNAGKSLLVKTHWYSKYILNVYRVILSLKMSPDKEIKEYVKESIKWVFSESDQLNGFILIQDNIYNFRITFIDGLLDDFNLEIHDIPKFISNPVPISHYCASSARSFTSLNQYASTKNALGLKDMTGTVDELNKICLIFKLYDVMWFEHIFNIIKNMNDPQKKILIDSLDKINLEVDELIIKNNMLFLRQGDDIKSVSSYSEGVQSIMMLVLGLF